MYVLTVGKQQKKLETLVGFNISTVGGQQKNQPFKEKYTMLRHGYFSLIYSLSHNNRNKAARSIQRTANYFIYCYKFFLLFLTAKIPAEVAIAAKSHATILISAVCAAIGDDAVWSFVTGLVTTAVSLTTAIGIT